MDCPHRRTCFARTMEGSYECIKTYETDRPLNDAVISPLFNDQVNPMFHILLVGGQDAKSVTTTSASLGKFEALLWHMVYQEEIGTVRGHFGPLNTLAWRSLSRRTSSSRRFLA